jgi:hypothetical protein
LDAENAENAETATAGWSRRHGGTKKYTKNGKNKWGNFVQPHHSHTRMPIIGCNYLNKVSAFLRRSLRVFVLRDQPAVAVSRVYAFSASKCS